MAEITVHFTFILRDFFFLASKSVVFFFSRPWLFKKLYLPFSFQVTSPSLTQPWAFCPLHPCLLFSRRPSLLITSRLSALHCHHTFKADGPCFGFTCLHLESHCSITLLGLQSYLCCLQHFFVHLPWHSRLPESRTSELSALSLLLFVWAHAVEMWEKNTSFGTNRFFRAVLF